VEKGQVWLYSAAANKPSDKSGRGMLQGHANPNEDTPCHGAQIGILASGLPDIVELEGDLQNLHNRFDVVARGLQLAEETIQCAGHSIQAK